MNLAIFLVFVRGSEIFHDLGIDYRPPDAVGFRRRRRRQTFMVIHSDRRRRRRQFEVLNVGRKGRTAYIFSILDEGETISACHNLYLIGQKNVVKEFVIKTATHEPLTTTRRENGECYVCFLIIKL